MLSGIPVPDLVFRCPAEYVFFPPVGVWVLAYLLRGELPFCAYRGNSRDIRNKGLRSSLLIILACFDNSTGKINSECFCELAAASGCISIFGWIALYFSASNLGIVSFFIIISSKFIGSAQDSRA